MNITHLQYICNRLFFWVGWILIYYSQLLSLLMGKTNNDVVLTANSQVGTDSKVETHIMSVETITNMIWPKIFFVLKCSLTSDSLCKQNSMHCPCPCYALPQPSRISQKKAFFLLFSLFSVNSTAYKQYKLLVAVHVVILSVRHEVLDVQKLTPTKWKLIWCQSFCPPKSTKTSCLPVYKPAAR